VDTVPNPDYKLLYEDIGNKQVYFLSSGSQEPELLYDFSLQVGDTFNSECVTGGNNLIVQQIEDIQLLNGETRKKWTFEGSYGPGPNTWIEGIGMETGLFGDMIQFEWWTRLGCVQKDGEHLWESEEYFGGCWGTVGENEITSSEINIYPNPAKDFVRISMGNQYQNARIQIFNSLGQTIVDKGVMDKYCVIDISYFDQGIYLILIRSGNNIWTEKLVVN